jgi:hypothetical protein
MLVWTLRSLKDDSENVVKTIFLSNIFRIWPKLSFRNEFRYNAGPTGDPQAPPYKLG